VALRAGCDLAVPGEDPGGQDATAETSCTVEEPHPAPVPPGRRYPSRGTLFKVREFALLSDGREVTLLDDRGWGTSAPVDRITLTQVVRNVHNVVLPDDTEETGEEHEWQRFAERLREAGVVVSLEELRALPYSVILSDRLRSRLGLPS
jgi:hypothetical protein